ncbi:MAG: S8 family serine peptidase [Bacteroidota bacterium]|nr:S8 family serine peptidase [Bacteroidota bacterium]
MRQRFLLSLLPFLCSVLLLPVVLHAQVSDSGDLQRYAPERLVLRTPAGTNQYTLSTKFVLVRFHDGVSPDRQRAVLDEEDVVAPVTEESFLPAPRVLLAALREDRSEQEVASLLARLSVHPDVAHAGAFLEFQDGTLHGIQDRVHVKLRHADDRAMLDQVAKEHNARVLEQYRFEPLVFVLEVDKHAAFNAFELSRLLQESGRFAWAEPDFLRLLHRLNTNDPALPLQWTLNNTGTPQQYNGTPGADLDVFNAWNLTTGSAAIKVAILDEGVDLNHPDLVANLLPGYDAMGLGSGGGPQGDDAHGTACAGIVAAVGNNGIGMAGIAYGCKIVPIRIAYSSGPYWVTSDAIIADALNWAWNQGDADVLSNSWGGGGASALINSAINNALTLGRGGLGASVIFAAGNGNGSLLYPANYNPTISVAAMSMCEQRKSPSSCDGETWWGSDYGTGLDVAAPGVKIYATDISGPAGYINGDYYATFNGTSSACPNTAGVMALIYSTNPLLTHDQARVILETTTEKVGGYVYTNGVAGQPNGSWSTELGYGRVNAYNAVLAALHSLCLTDNIPPTIVAPTNITIAASPELCSIDAALVNLGQPVANDNCPQNLTVSHDAPAVFPVGVTLVTWTAKDGGGNTASAFQTVTVVDTQAPRILACATAQTVEGDAQNSAVLPDLRNQINASDNCTAPPALVRSQTPAPGTTLGAGTHAITLTVADATGNTSSCNTTFTVVPRVEIEPAAAYVVVSGACKAPVIVTRRVRIDNGGGNFGGGVMQWNATESAAEITLLTSSGSEGDDLVFRVDPRQLATGTHARTITINAWNSATSVPAVNSPFSLTVSIQIEPLGAVSMTQQVGAGWTIFTNSSGQKIAEVKSNAGTINSFTVNMYPCTIPQGITRVRHVRRYFTMTSNAPSPNVDVRFFYTNTESQPLITRPELLTVWQRPVNVWVNRGGVSNVFENFVQVNGLTSIAGPFTMAHAYFPKEADATTAALPAAITLEQNYPNPFNPTTSIRFALPEAASVRLTVHDLLGREVALLADGMRDAGTHQVVFDANGLPSGTFVCVLEANGVLLRRSMMLMK